jgi:glucose-6-phosphate 1-dehydrogenase
VLAIRIQPDEGMSLRFLTKVPGPEMTAHPVSMDFRYGTSFGAAPPEAYERLLLDALLGDGTLFTRDDEVEASWEWITALRDAWAGSPVETPEPYEAGTWGPPSADAMLAHDHRRWRRP